MVRSGDRDRVHILQCEDFAKVLLLRRCLAHLALHSTCKLFQNVAIHIADMRDVSRASVRFERGEMSICTSIQPDHRKVKPIVGADDSFITPGSGSNSQPSRSYRHCL
jgi:hypothetical protein